MNKFLGYTIFIALIFGFFWAEVGQCNLKNKYLIGEAVIINADARGGTSSGGFWIDFVLIIGDKYYNGSSMYHLNKLKVRMVRKFFIGRRFPVAYYRKNPNNNQLLILESDFQKFHLPYPDSLNWVKDLTKMKSSEWELLDSNFMDKDTIKKNEGL